MRYKVSVATVISKEAKMKINVPSMNAAFKGLWKNPCKILQNHKIK